MALKEHKAKRDFTRTREPDVLGADRLEALKEGKLHLRLQGEELDGE